MAIVFLCLVGQEVFGQIPIACSDVTSLENLACCPATSDGVCGQDASKGQCTELNLPGYDRSSVDARHNWPHYFTRICKCNGNYSGYGCNRCKFGHYGPDCSQSHVLPRRPIANYTDSDWADFIDTIVQSRSFDSGYMVVLEEAAPGTTNLSMTNISLYNFYVWMHHYAAKDSNTMDLENRLDYAHAGPAFTTWHRYFNLWFVSSSPNDPLFILHHAMVDCMFDKWLELHPDAEYPNDIPMTVTTTGHQPDDFMVPFFPLSTNADMFTRSSNFGYSCDLPNITNPQA
ncbi:tyrosinase-like [Dysidea avara]|uniref:tyrosinase-like n=1 Tax=Dysidea avara TaxID=196820 RepID=UPI00332C0180